MSVRTPSVEIEVVDLSARDVVDGAPKPDARSHRTARLTSTEVSMRKNEDRPFNSHRLGNRSAELRVGEKLERPGTSCLTLFRVPVLHVWALWDHDAQELFPVSDRPRFLPEDRYGADEFFTLLRSRAQRLVAAYDRAKALGIDDIGG